MKDVCRKATDNLSEIKSKIPQILNSSEDQCSAELRVFDHPLHSPCSEENFAPVELYHEILSHCEICSLFLLYGVCIYQSNSLNKLGGFNSVEAMLEPITESLRDPDRRENPTSQLIVQ